MSEAIGTVNGLDDPTYIMHSSNPLAPKKTLSSQSLPSEDMTANDLVFSPGRPEETESFVTFPRPGRQLALGVWAGQVANEAMAQPYHSGEP